MSFQAMTWAVEAPCTSAGQKLVLLMLANHCNGHTGRCTPSHKLLALECCMGVSTLKGHLSALEASGFIEIIRRQNEGVDLPNQYRLNMPLPGQNLAREGSESGRGRGQNLATEPGKKNQEKEPGNTPLAPQVGESPKRADPLKPDGVPDQVWVDFVAMRKQKRAPVTETAIKLLRAEADKAGLSLTEALETCCANGWQGFKADWILSRAAPRLPAARHGRQVFTDEDRRKDRERAAQILGFDPHGGDILEGEVLR